MSLKPPLEEASKQFDPVIRIDDSSADQAQQQKAIQEVCSVRSSQDYDFRL